MADLLIRNVEEEMARRFREESASRRMTYHDYLERLIALHATLLDEHPGQRGAEAWSRSVLDHLELEPNRRAGK